MYANPKPQGWEIQLAADLAVMIVAHHGTNVTQSLCDEPENYHLREDPEELEHNMSEVIREFMHLAELAEIPWSRIMKQAEDLYREYIDELSPL